MSISYHTQFRENQRNKISNGLLSNSKATTGGQLPAQRPTAVVKQPIRSDTFTLPTKRHETNSKVPKVNQTQNDLRQQRFNQPLVRNTLPPAEVKRTEMMRKTTSNTRTITKQRHPVFNQQSGERRPVRFTTNYDNTYYSASPLPPVPAPPPPPAAAAYYPKSAPAPRADFDNSKRIHNTNDDYVIHRQKTSPAYNYSEYHTVSELPSTSFQRSLPRIAPTTNPTTPTVIIHSKESSSHSDPPTVVIHKEPTIRSDPPKFVIHSKNEYPQTVLPSYHPNSAPFMFLPNSNVPTSAMFLPNSTIPSYSTTSQMILPNQAPLQTFLLQPPPPTTYMQQPLFYPMHFPTPRPTVPPPPPPPLPPPPPPVPQTIINQSSSSSSAAPATVHTENKTEDNRATIVLQPNTIAHSRKNMTIQLKMLDEVCFTSFLFS